MADDRIWLVTEDFAAMAGISPQAANKALRASRHGLPWRGCILAVRQRVGRGGRSGLVNEVAFDSLPTTLGSDVEDRSAKDRVDRVTPPSNPPGEFTAERWDAIREVLSYPRDSAERSEAVAHAASRTGKSVRTLYRWIRSYEARGVRGLCPVRPSNSGQRRVAVSRAFDRAGKADSAIAYYAAYFANPAHNLGNDATNLAGSHERLGQLYDAKGQNDKAAEHYRKFIELWKNADPELQPRVAAAKDRLKTLTPTERPKR